MEGIGQVVARRGGSPGASEVPGIGSPVSSDMPSRPSVRKPSTAAGPAADPSWNAGLLLGFESLHGLGEPGPEEVPGLLLKQSSGRGESTPTEEPVLGLLHKQSSGRGESSPAEEPVPGLLLEQSSGRGESTLTEEPAAGLSAVSAVAGAAVLEAVLLEGAAATDALRSIAADEVRLLGFVEAADFAGR
ncbi:hypothetical protein HAV21_16925, partial [Paenarthrobacter sp. MSM-2-10-13]|nr:hypothetical protein [Paenarthrobacter sp. MSM-2-10-13]